jgi:general secretion pathway protein A
VYQSYYNLTGKPFRLSPDPAFFFPSRGHKRALAYLRYGLNQDEGFVVITGAPGTGKTTLAKILLQEMDAGVVVAHLTTTQLEADDMLRMVAASFGLRYEGLDKAQLLKSLENFLLARSRERKRALLVIDEAQNLPSRSLEELRMLSNLQIGDKALLQIFLLGQEQFRHMLDNPMLEQLRQRVIANYHLTPLGADECQRYVESRLHHVNWNNDPHFAEVAHELIHQFTDGIPRRINMLCDRILLFGCMEETHEITGEVVNLVKSEMDEEISGRIPSAEDSGQRANSGQATAAKPQSQPTAARESQDTAAKSEAPSRASVSEQRKQEKPDRKIQQVAVKPEPQSQAREKLPDQAPAKEERIPATGLENLNLEKMELENLGLANDASVFDDSDSSDEFEDLDIDYAMFADQKPEGQPGENTPNKKSQADAAPGNPKSIQSAIRELEEKLVSKDKQASSASTDTSGKSSDKLKEKATTSKQAKQSNKPSAGKQAPEHTESSGGKHVLGNTVQKPKPESVKSDNEEPTQHSEISERDLFRVIPGGKSFKIPGLGDNEDKPAVAASANAEPSSSDVRLRRILRLVLAFHRSPSRFPGLDTPAQPLPEGITELLELAISDDQVLNQVSPAAVMGISPVMLRAAVRFFVRRALFTPDGDHYRTLGLHPDATLAQIEKHYDLLMRLLRQDKQRGSADSVERVGDAYEALSRGEHAPSAASKSKPTENKPVFEDAISSDNAGDIDNSDLIIDFDEVDRNPPKPAAPTFVAKPNERFNPAASGKMSRKTVRYASQLAVLGFGALVIVLGLYIVQLEPSKAPGKNSPTSIAQNDNVLNDAQASSSDNAASASMQGRTDQNLSAEERQRGLLFNDGTADSRPTESSTGITAAINAEADATQDFTQESRAKMAEIDEGSSETTSNYESPLVSGLDFDPEKVTSQSGDASSRQQEPSAQRQEPSAQRQELSRQQETSSVTAESQASASQREPLMLPPASASSTPSVTNQPARQPANRFEGRDIEIVEKPSSNRESFSSIASRTQTARATRSGVASGAAAGAAAASSAPAAAAQPEQIAASTPTPQSSASSQPGVTITNAELINLVNKFLAYYQSADLDKVMGLFASDARTNNRTNAQGIRSDYVELFKSTTKRKMHINSLNWSIENDYARGIGDYQAQINPEGTQNSQTFSGNITIQVQKDNQGLKITRFYFSNQSVSTGPRMQEGGTAAPQAVAAAAAAPQASQSPAAKPANITAQDLQNLVNDFAQTYANGDLDGLMALFADNAKTNDQSSVAGIRKDYSDLFKGTKARQMIINNMKWTLNGQQATGQGPFEVKVQPKKGNNSTTVVKGSLKMTVVKDGNTSQITEMIHAIQ